MTTGWLPDPKESPFELTADEDGTVTLSIRPKIFSETVSVSPQMYGELANGDLELIVSNAVSVLKSFLIAHYGLEGELDLRMRRRIHQQLPEVFHAVQAMQYSSPQALMDKLEEILVNG